VILFLIRFSPDVEEAEEREQYILKVFAGLIYDVNV